MSSYEKAVTVGVVSAAAVVVFVIVNLLLRSGTTVNAPTGATNLTIHGIAAELPVAASAGIENTRSNSIPEPNPARYELEKVSHKFHFRFEFKKDGKLLFRIEPQRLEYGRSSDKFDIVTLDGREWATMIVFKSGVNFKSAHQDLLDPGDRVIFSPSGALLAGKRHRSGGIQSPPILMLSWDEEVKKYLLRDSKGEVRGSFNEDSQPYALEIDISSAKHAPIDEVYLAVLMFFQRFKVLMAK